MPLQLSATAEVLIEKRNITPNLIIEIHGIDTLYSSVKTYKLARFDEDDLLFDDPELFFDIGIEDENVKTYISLGETGTTISQQLLQDKGGVSSVSSFAVELIDKDQEITRLITPGVVVDELLDRRAKVYVNFSGGLHPEDSMLIHSGVIDEINSGPASIKLNIASPESLKRQKLFIPFDTKLNGSITDSDTTITVDSTDKFLSQYGSEFETLIKVDNEIIKYTGKTSTTFTGCTRARLGSVAIAHSDNSTVTPFYRVVENAINFALKLMMSQGDEFFDEKQATHIAAKSVSEPDEHIIYFSNINVKELYGIVVGDIIDISSSTSNDGTYIITGLDSDYFGSWIEVAESLSLELDTTGVVSFKSQFNVWPEGMGMTPYDVDVQGHIDIRDQYFSSIPEYDFYFGSDGEEINGKDFLSKEVYFPSGLYALQRKTKSGCQIVLPPISTSGLKKIDSTNIINASSLRPVRSTNKNFYNSIVFKYDKSSLEDKYLRGQIVYSADSQSRFKNQGNKPMIIESNGLRDSGSTDSIISINSRRLLDRYKFAAEFFSGVKILFKAGLQIEIGDVVLFGDESLKITDVSRGDRFFESKAYECINKSINLKSGEVSLDLLSTGFDLEARYGGISPSTEIGSGSTTTQIVVLPSFGNTTLKQEKRKWQNLVGQEINIHNDDYSINEITTLDSFSTTDESVFIVDPALSAPPASGLFIDIAPYPTGVDPDERNLLKSTYCFIDPYATVTGGSSGTVFSLSLGDAAKLNVGLPIVIHNESWSIVSNEVKVLSVVGTAITVESDLGLTPSVGQIVELIGFKDLGSPYRMV